MNASNGHRRRPRRVACIGICASTGGPAALQHVLGALPASFPVPVLVVQHIADGFVDGLVKVLDARVPLPVQIAGDGSALTAGVWVAPSGQHLTLDEQRRMTLADEPAHQRHRPSGDLLLESLAQRLGRRAVGVVLTGMGRDGARGAASIQAAGGLAFAQDERGAVAYGMPRAAAAAGSASLSLDEIVAELRELRPVLA